MTNRLLVGALFVALISPVGCQPEQIESYQVPKEAAREAIPTAAAASEPTDRMLAAVLPEADRAWFFKVTGPQAAVDSVAKQFGKFLTSVRLAAGQPHPDWQIPDGWQQQPGSGMRAASLVIPTNAEPLELSVTALPWSGAPGEMLSNVNRWRGQLQLPATDEQGLAKCTRELKIGDATMTVVDLRGRFQAGGMTPPFAGGATGNPQPPAAGGAKELPPGHPPITSQAPTTNTAPFQYEVPAGWQPRPAGGMRKAEFQLEDGDRSATLTVLDFPATAGPMMANPVANVNRWRGEVGLPQLSAAEVKDSTQQLAIDGDEAIVVDAVPAAGLPEQSQAARGTLAAMLTRGDTIWFFKLTGDRDLVASQREKFQEFLKSVRFTDRGGASDGD